LTLCLPTKAPPDQQLDQIPTIVIDATRNCRTDQFEIFARFFDSWDQRNEPLHFYLCPADLIAPWVEKFVRRAAAIDNHEWSPENPDQLFSLVIAPLNVARKRTRTRAGSPTSRRSSAKTNPPSLLHEPIARMSSAPKQWEIETNRNGEMRLKLVGVSGSEKIPQRHFFANFLLLVAPMAGSTVKLGVVLVDYPKGRWRYDVPGGKFTKTDGAAEENVAREIFEELGWMIDKDRICGPIGLKYETHSLREDGLPGVIQYFYYKLDLVTDTDWPLCRAKKVPSKSTKHRDIVVRELDKLIEEQTRAAVGRNAREVCHVPASVLKALKATLETSESHK
jgi:8-oxo-dGTP pyrophosphatase MutT (NUDIX family)